MEGTAPGVRFHATAEQWQSLLEEYRTSGKSGRGFCREKGIPPSQFSYHLRRARKTQEGHGFIEIVRESPSALCIEAGNCRIHVQRGFDAELLRQVAKALS
jgi:hypothetical protein